MHPEIVSFGPFAIRTYGLFLATGFLVSILFAAWRAKKAGLNPDYVYNLSFWIILSSLIGARLYYVVTHYDEFRAPSNLPFVSRLAHEFVNMFWPIGTNGQIGINGLVFYGGLIAATVATAVFLRVHRLSIPRFMDILAPSLGIGIFFTRIGCFFNGCCYGKPTDSFLGVCFPPESAAGYFYPGQALYPTQLFQSAWGLAIFLALLLVDRYKRFDGLTALAFFLMYAVARFTVDFYRAYEPNLYFLGLSHNQWVSIVTFTVSGGLMLFFSLRTNSQRSHP
jgi:phosphatidylglycerol:prolipoprotein diacylglycerol transferase